MSVIKATSSRRSNTSISGHMHVKLMYVHLLEKTVADVIKNYIPFGFLYKKRHKCNSLNMIFAITFNKTLLDSKDLYKKYYFFYINTYGVFSSKFYTDMYFVQSLIFVCNNFKDF